MPWKSIQFRLALASAVAASSCAGGLAGRASCRELSTCPSGGRLRAGVMGEGDGGEHERDRQDEGQLAAPAIPAVQAVLVALGPGEEHRGLT